MRYGLCMSSIFFAAFFAPHCTLSITFPHTELLGQMRSMNRLKYGCLSKGFGDEKRIELGGYISSLLQDDNPDNVLMKGVSGPPPAELEGTWSLSYKCMTEELRGTIPESFKLNAPPRTSTVKVAFQPDCTISTALDFWNPSFKSLEAVGETQSEYAWSGVDLSGVEPGMMCNTHYVAYTPPSKFMRLFGKKLNLPSKGQCYYGFMYLYGDVWIELEGDGAGVNCYIKDL